MQGYSSARRLAIFAPPLLAIGAGCVLAALGAPLRDLAVAVPLIIGAGILAGLAGRRAALAVSATALAAVLLVGAHGPALAAENTIRIAWGDWAIGVVGVIMTAGAPILFRLWNAIGFIPPAIKTLLTEQLLNRALDYGYAAVKGAAKDKVLEIPVANEVLRTAAQYALDHGAPWLLKYIGDLGPKLLARMGANGALQPEASALSVYLDPTRLER